MTSPSPRTMPARLMEATLDQLCISPFNVRSNGEATGSTEALMASIAARGLLQPLIVHDMALHRDRALADEPVAVWGVLAGGRRLRAIRQLAAAGQWPEDRTVDIVLHDLDPAEITELSLAENLLRRDLEPYEVHAAVAQAAAEGASEEEIAANIGQSPAWVRRELRLGSLVPEIFAAYAAGELSRDQAQAFAATADAALQRAAWAHFAPLKDWDRQPHRIRMFYKVGDNELASLLRFVGDEAYSGAGGRFELDLFADGPADQQRFKGRICDEGILRELAEGRMAHIRQELRRLTRRSDLRFLAQPPQKNGGSDMALLVDAMGFDVAGGEALDTSPIRAIDLPDGEIAATLEVGADGGCTVRWWWVNHAARKAASKVAEATGDAPQTARAPVTSFGHRIENGKAFEPYSTYAQTARAAVKDEYGLTADGLQVMRSLRREVLRAVLVADAVAPEPDGPNTIGRDYALWALLRQELGDRTMAAAAATGARGLARSWSASDDAESVDVVESFIEDGRAAALWSGALESIKSAPWMREPDPALSFAIFAASDDYAKALAGAVLSGMILMRSANTPGWRVAAHDAAFALARANDKTVRELVEPTPRLMGLFPRMKRLELAKPYVAPEAFAEWLKLGDQILTGAAAGALREAPDWVHPLLRFPVPPALADMSGDNEVVAQAQPEAEQLS